MVSTPTFRRLGAGLAIVLTGCATAGTPATIPPAAAAPQLRAALANDPDNANLSWRLAAALHAGGRTAEARTVLDASLARHPDHAASLQLLGAVLESLRDDGRAAAAYERLLALPDAGNLRGPVSARLAAVRRRIQTTGIQAALRQEALLAETPPLARTVAVFPFSYTGSDQRLEPLGRALTHMLVTDLAATDRLKVLERLQVQLLADEIARSGEGLIDPATGVRGGRLLGAERVIQGQVGGGDDHLSLQAGILDNTADSVAPTLVEADDALDRFYELETRMALDLFTAMGIELTEVERERVGQRATRNLEAILAFGLGLEAQDAGRYTEARAHFARAVEIDPGFGEAADALDLSVRLETAESWTPTEFVALGAASTRPTPTELWLERRATYRGIEMILPGLGARDPFAEVIDDEGLAPRAGTIRILIPRPGGDR